MTEHANQQRTDDLSSLLSALDRVGRNRDTKRGYIADNDVMDSLRLESSTISPSLNSLLVDFGTSLIGALEDSYGKFIPEQTLEQSAGIVDRLLCVSRDDYELFDGAWRSISDSPQIDDTSLGIFHRFYGRMIVFQAPTRIIESFNQALTPSQFEQLGGRDEAYKKILSTYFFNLLTHEIVHEYADGNHTREFEESGADYYAQELSAQSGLPYGHLVGYGIAPKAFYAQLIEKYGNDMHRVFFGSPLEKFTNQQIMGEFTPEKIAELFPRR